jgi:hypothetical protein
VPLIPNTPNPADGTVGVTTRPTLSWHSTGATSYEVRLSTSAPPAAAATTFQFFYTPPPLARGTRYFWQVVATNGAGSSTGPVWSFVTEGQ